jgi:type III restriction enzyme
MARTLKQFQENAVQAILAGAKYKLTSQNKVFVFKSPTGSGKTFMMSQVLTRMADTDNVDFNTMDLCFLWVSIGKGDLEKQSAKSLQEAYEGSPQVTMLEAFAGSKDIIEKNEVIVFNWEKIRTRDRETGEWKNVVMKDGERNSFVDVLNGTREAGRKIVLIIDESHSAARTERAREMIDEVIKPNLIIEMSATPILSEQPDYTVNPQDVIDEELIKKDIVINEGFTNNDDASELDTEQSVLLASWNKLTELEGLFKKKKIGVKPLLLIQLPNSEAGEAKKDVAIEFLRDQGISQENGNLAIWLSEEKFLADKDLVKNDSPVRVLIFKQAIDTGWDCPRAHILLKWRESASITFEVQVLGRILRMPEAKHYDDDVLNRGYVFTNTPNINVKREVYGPNIIKTLVGKKRDGVKNITLRSYYRTRTTYNDITAGLFSGIFENKFAGFFGLNGDASENYKTIKGWKGAGGEKVEMDGDLRVDIMSDVVISGGTIDETARIEDDSQTSLVMSENDLRLKIEAILGSELAGYQAARSIPVMKNTLIGIIKKYLGKNIVWIDAFIIYNEAIVKSILRDAVADFKQKKDKVDAEKLKELEIWNDAWQIPEEKSYNEKVFAAERVENYFYDKAILEIEKSEPEKKFVDLLKQSKKVLWWWKNGDEHMQENFGIKIDEKGKTFQPDFIVKYTDGTIGIYDTKPIGDRVDDTKVKAEALHGYIKKQKKVVGGIVIFENGVAKINSKEVYRDFRECAEDWTDFSQ